VRGSNRFGEALLVLGSATAFLCVSEVAARFLPARGPNGYAPVNTRLRANRRENSRGFRDEDRPLSKPPGVRRLVCLGDSFTWGTGVEREDAYPQRLERGLRRRRRETWEVLNLAKEGMNSVDEAALLAQEGLNYEPDAVLLGYVLNDSEDESSAKARRAAGIAEARLSPAFLWDHLAFYRFVGTRLWATKDNAQRTAEYKEMYAETAPGWVAAQKALRGMGVLCRRHRALYVVAVFPLFANPLDDAYPFAEIHGKVVRAAARSGAKVVDLLSAFRGLRWDLLVVDGYMDEHPNEMAHRIAAHALLDVLDTILPAGAPAPKHRPPEARARARRASWPPLATRTPTSPRRGSPGASR